MKKIGLYLIVYFTVLVSIAQQFTIIHKGVSRSYIVHKPAGYTKEISCPLVLNFHGMTMTAQLEQSMTKMDVVSDAKKFIVVYPQGLNNTWNAGINNATVDDLGFVNTLLDTLIFKYNVNPARVYATGFSMGGYFSYVLACKLSNRIAAIAPVSGVMSANTTRNCSAVRSVPVMHMHGTNDGVVSYNGVAPSIAYWRNENNCLAPVETSKITGTITLNVYNRCNANTEVRLYEISAGTHTWPDPKSGFDASLEIWNFFNRFSLPIPVTNIEENFTFQKVNVYPNPCKEKIYVEYYGAVEGEAILAVSNLTSQNILQEKVIVKQGYNTIHLNRIDAAKGIHFLTLTQGNTINTVKLILE